MNNRIVAAMRKFEVDVYANLTTKDELKDYLINRLQLEVWSGQKRLVVFDPNDPNTVYKIAYSDQGIIDNIHEVACSLRLMELAQEGQISQDDLILFGEARLLDGNPFIIRMTAATNFIKDPDFIAWFNRERQNKDLNENQMFPQYVSSHERLRLDANRQQQILAKYFKPSDVTIFKEPKNFCFRTDSMGNKRLVLIDLGSVCPNLVQNGQIVNIPCPKCGSPRLYVTFEIKQNLTTAASELLEGMYLCSNPNCVDYYQTATNGVQDYQAKDSFVYSKYLMDNAPLVRVMRAQYGYYFIPDQEVHNRTEYMNQMRRTLGGVPNGDILNVMYRNYLSTACGFLIGMYGDDIRRIPAFRNNGIVGFIEYLNMFNQTMQRCNHPITEVTKRCAALVYLSILTQRSQNVTVFDTLVQPDLNTFANTIYNEFRVDQANGMALYNALNLR